MLSPIYRLGLIIMIKVDDLTNELSKYEIPNEDQIII